MALAPQVASKMGRFFVMGHSNVTRRRFGGGGKAKGQRFREKSLLFLMYSMEWKDGKFMQI